MLSSLEDNELLRMCNNNNQLKKPYFARVQKCAKLSRSLTLPWFFLYNDLDVVINNNQFINLTHLLKRQQFVIDNRRPCKLDPFLSHASVH